MANTMLDSRVARLETVARGSVSPGGEGDRLGGSNGRRNGRIDLGVADTGQLSGVAAESANATVGGWDQLIYRCGEGPCQDP
jgi:hypothetical protein